MNKNPINKGVSAVAVIIVVVLSVLAFGCGANENILKSGKETPSPTTAAPAVTSIKKDIEDMRTANFEFIYVLRRKDGGEIDAEDKAVIKVQTAEMNRRVSSEGGKAFVIGSNFALAPEKLAALNARFAVENLSAAPVVNQANTANAK